jgi:hypothetical protein
MAEMKNSLSPSGAYLQALACSDSYLNAEEPPDFKLDLRMDFLPEGSSISGRSRTLLL